jgi:hypothetical protein
MPEHLLHCVSSKLKVSRKVAFEEQEQEQEA